MRLSADDSLGTTSLYLTLAVVSMVLVWANNEFVMTREVFNVLAGSPDGSYQAELQYEALHRARFWGYLLVPAQAAARIGFVALLIQMMCLIGGIEIAFGRVFRIAAVAFGALLFGSLLQILWIALLPTEAVTRASLGIVPDSLAAWLAASAEMPALVYLILSKASLTSLLWMLLLYWGLRETNRLQRSEAAFVTVSVWLSLSALHIGATMFARTLVN